MTQEFHIHIDASWLSEDFEQLLSKEMGFWRMDFCRGGDKSDSYAPDHHLTKKFWQPHEFRSHFDRIDEAIKAGDAMVGYVEGEFLPLDVDIAAKEFNQTVEIPFRLEMSELPAGEFRETEVHVTLSRDQSQRRLRDNLRSMGFLVAQLPKKYGIAEVYTAQGSRQVISDLIPLLLNYLNAAGGAVAASVKEERIARWLIAGANVRLAPIVSAVRVTAAGNKRAGNPD